MFKSLLSIGDPGLRGKAVAVTPELFSSRWLRDLSEHMRATMAQEGGCGLAAPQVGEQLRMFVVEFDPQGDPEMDAVDFTVVVNPRLRIDRVKSSLVRSWESCLSVPGKAGLVPRQGRVTLDYLDLNGGRHSALVTGFLAALVQHENDHLDGVIFTDHISIPSDLIDAATLTEQRLQEGCTYGKWTR